MDELERFVFCLGSLLPARSRAVARLVRPLDGIGRCVPGTDERFSTSCPRASLAVGPGLKILMDRPRARRRAPSSSPSFVIEVRELLGAL